MNIRKIFLFLILFAAFMGSRLLLANIQMQQAGQIMAARGLSNNSRKLESSSKEKISAFLLWLEKRNFSDRVQLHLVKRKNPAEVLVWSNKDVAKLPLQDGHYFTKDDFQGQTTFAVAAQNSPKLILRQNNQYFVYHGHYISVIGDFKDKTDRIYLTTGVKQITARQNLAQYEITCDCKNQNTMRKISRHLHAKQKLPNFVRQLKHYQLTSVVPLSFAILLLVLLAAFASGFLASLTAGEARLTALHGSLLGNWLINRTVRILLIEMVLGIGSFLVVSTKCFTTNKNIIFMVLLAVYLSCCASYVSVLTKKMRRSK